MDNLCSDWKQALNQVLCTNEFAALKERVEAEYKQYKVAPPQEKIFAAFNACSFRDTRVVILGQDPYFNPGQAVGLAFSVPHNCAKFPPTLRNIIKEVRSNLGFCAVEDGDLTPWARQGVLLLNTCLTVREGQPLSHNNLGWDLFIDATIKKLNEKDGIVFVLWGSNAKKYSPLLTNPNNLILTSVHPSPLSADRGFKGCGHFKKINDFLVSKGQKPIKF